MPMTRKPDLSFLFSDFDTVNDSTSLLRGQARLNIELVSDSTASKHLTQKLLRSRSFVTSLVENWDKQIPTPINVRINDYTSADNLNTVSVEPLNYWANHNCTEVFVQGRVI